MKKCNIMYTDKKSTELSEKESSCKNMVMAPKRTYELY